MPAPATTTSGRLLSLLSLLQARRDWPGSLLARRLEVSERTVRRDVDRLRDLGYPIHAARGPDGGYRLEAGSRLPPLLFDDDQAVALAVALQLAVATGAGIEEAAARALVTVRQVMPAALRRRTDDLQVRAVGRGGGGRHEQTATAVLLAVGEAVRNHEELRFDYATAAAAAEDRPPRRTRPHHLFLRAGRWYLLGRDPLRDDWRTYRVDRMTLRTPGGPRFTPHEVPGDVDDFLAGTFKGSATGDTWPCTGEVVLALPAAAVAPFAGDGTVEDLGPDRCRLRLGSWSWAGLAAGLARFDADLEVVGPPELRAAFTRLAERAARAGSAGRTLS